MCNLSEAIWDEGMEKGIEKGRLEGMEKGLEEGIEKGRLMQLYELIKAGTITTEQAAKSLNMTVDSFNDKLESIEE